MYFVQYIYKTKQYALWYHSLNKMADVTTNEADEVSDTDSSCGRLVNFNCHQILIGCSNLCCFLIAFAINLDYFYYW